MADFSKAWGQVRDKLAKIVQQEEGGYVPPTRIGEDFILRTDEMRNVVKKLATDGGWKLRERYKEIPFTPTTTAGDIMTAFQSF